MNKVDLVSKPSLQVILEVLAREGLHPIPISARAGTGLEKLTEAMVRERRRLPRNQAPEAGPKMETAAQ